MWRGREESCPYYDDPPVWDPEGHPKCVEDSEGSTLKVDSSEAEIQVPPGHGMDSDDENSTETATQLDFPRLRNSNEANITRTQLLT